MSSQLSSAVAVQKKLKFEFSKSEVEEEALCRSQARISNVVNGGLRGVGGRD